MFLETSKQIWETAKKTYSKAQDAAVVYELKTRIAHTRQGNLSVIEYYNLLTNLWQEMDLYQKLKLSEGTQAILREREQDRVFEFLAGLNEEFDHVQIQILGRESLPNLNETFYTIRGEESCRAVMLENASHNDSALIAAKKENKGTRTDYHKTSNCDNLWCTHCKKPRRTRENCFKLHGKETVLNKIKQQRTQANHTQANLTVKDQPKTPEHNSASALSLNEDEVGKLRAFLETLTTSPCSLSQPGKCLNCDSFKASKSVPRSWVIDSGATDHMTHSPKPFKTYNPCTSPKSILMANGTPVKVMGEEPLKVYSRRNKAPSTRQHAQLLDPTPTETHGERPVSEYPLAAKYCLGMICEALEQKWKIS
ncbi:hypothetical protein L6164_037419 [Bauhinia variegata]|uniref:Uncharacterized protein n=1 Tax=Bauhinia variegata TaxID=167791 RepID=A0ACB9KJZ8_BAUVA|nr:hypothetical protein L6164_037419 [Bauhinia variegata]